MVSIKCGTLEVKASYITITFISECRVNTNVCPSNSTLVVSLLADTSVSLRFR